MKKQNKKMDTITAQKKNTNKSDFAELRQEDPILTAAQKRTLAQAERNLREGKTLSLDEFRKEMGFGN